MGLEESKQEVEAQEAEMPAIDVSGVARRGQSVSNLVFIDPATKGRPRECLRL